MKKIALLSLSAVLLAGCTMGGITTDQAEKTAMDFIEILAPGNEITMKSVETVAGGDFKITVDANGQEIVSYLSPDGTTFYPQGLDIADVTAQAAAFEAANAAAAAQPETMPVEADGGIGDGAEPLDELLEEENAEEVSIEVVTEESEESVE